MIYSFVLDDSLTSFMRMTLGACKIGLSPQLFYITYRSKAILLLWFYFFYVLQSIFFVLFEPYVRFHTLYTFSYFY